MKRAKVEIRRRVSGIGTQDLMPDGGPKLLKELPSRFSAHFKVDQGGDLQVSTWALSESIPQLERVVFQGNMRMIYATPIASIGRYNRQGTLVVGLIDSRTNTSAWLGMVTESLDNKPGAGQKKISKAAEDLFKKFPVKKQGR